MIPKIKLAGIYLIVHKESGMFYLGKSVDIFSRWSSHYTSLRFNKHSSKKFQQLWNKTKIEDWEWKIINYQSITEFKKNNPELKNKLVDKSFSKHLLQVEKMEMKNYSINLSLNSDNKHFS